MAHKKKGDCPIATAIFIRKQADKKGSSVREMIKEYAKESGLPKDTLDRWVWPRKPSAVKSNGANKTLRKNIDGGTDAIKKGEGEVAGEDMENDEGPDAPDKFQRLLKNIVNISKGLEEFGNGLITPDNEDDLIAARRIYAALEFMCLQTARTGVNLAKIHKTFEREKLFNTK